MDGVAFVRALNVGGRNRASMDAIKDCFGSLSCTRVSTYLQSGNILFARPQALAEAEVEEAIEERLGLSLKVMVRSRRELSEVAKNHPQGASGKEAPGWYVAFLKRPLPDGAHLAAPERPGERCWLRGKEVYLHLPDGFGRSRLAATLERRLQAVATARTWRVTLNLLKRLEG